jgi:hypothetical protein
MDFQPIKIYDYQLGEENSGVSFGRWEGCDMELSKTLNGGSNEILKYAS